MAPRTLTLEQILAPYEQASEQNAPALANTNIFVSDLTPVITPCLFRIQVCISAAATFSARITEGGNTQPFIFNDDTDLTVDAGYIFDLLVHDGDTINFQFDAITTIRNLRIQEIRGGVQ